MKTTHQICDSEPEKFYRTFHANTPADIASAIARGGSRPTNLRTDSIRLLYYYQRVSPRRRRPISFFLESAVSNPLRALIRTKAELEDAATSSLLHKTALEIIEEFMTPLEHQDQRRKHKTAQRKVLKNKRPKFFDALVLRDGKQCARCKSKRKKLVIDHIKPIAKWGVTELVNLQLLCRGCNSEKSDRSIEA